MTDRTAGCRCTHDKNIHEHLRHGTDCSVCPCPKFRRPSWRQRFRNFLEREVIGDDPADEPSRLDLLHRGIEEGRIVTWEQLLSGRRDEGKAS